MNNIKGKAIISYCDNPLLDELYPKEKWRREYFKTTRQVVNGQNNIAVEMLLMNYDNPL